MLQAQMTKMTQLLQRQEPHAAGQGKGRGKADLAAAAERGFGGRRPEVVEAGGMAGARVEEVVAETHLEVTPYKTDLVVCQNTILFVILSCAPLLGKA